MQSRSNRNKKRSFLFSNGVKNMDRFIILHQVDCFTFINLFGKKLFETYCFDFFLSLSIDWLID